MSHLGSDGATLFLLSAPGGLCGDVTDDGSMSDLCSCTYASGSVFAQVLFTLVPGHPGASAFSGPGCGSFCKLAYMALCGGSSARDECGASARCCAGTFDNLMVKRYIQVD